MSIQNKIFIGIGSFVGIMLLVGWIAINEPARMEVFTQQWEGRSIERGAVLYHNACVVCHGEDAKGIVGKAPGIKNPMLFLDQNPAKVVNTDLTALVGNKTSLERALADLETNRTRREELRKQTEGLAADSEQLAALNKQIADIDAAIAIVSPDIQQQIDGLTVQIAEKQAELDKLVADGWDPKRDTRLTEVAWAAGLESYLRTVLISGRPNSTGMWPGGTMPAWGQAGGGNMREDEIENLVVYLLNFREESVRLVPNDIHQQFKISADANDLPDSDKVVLGPNVDVATLDLAVAGDATKGQAAYIKYACAGCHTASSGAAYAVAPTEGTYTRIETVRLKQPENAGLSIEQYMAQSILYPSMYMVPGGAAGMPVNFSEQLSLDELRDIIAYLSTYK
jgi:mono/diheme cytochrome c family protein